MQSENEVSQSTRQTALQPTSDVNRRVLLEAYSAEFLARAVARKQTNTYLGSSFKWIRTDKRPFKERRQYRSWL